MPKVVKNPVHKQKLQLLGVADDFVSDYLKLDGSNANTTIDIQGQALRLGGASDIVQQIIQANATQTTNLTEWQNSSGTALSVVDKNGNVGIGTSTPTSTFSIYKLSTQPTSDMGYGGLTIPSFSSIFSSLGSGIFKYETYVSGAYGGSAINGFTDSDTNGIAFLFSGYQGSTTPTATNMLFRTAKHNGATSAAALAWAETAFQFRNWTSNLITVLGSGATGIGTETPTAQLQVNTLSASRIVQIIKGATSQTANLQEWQNSSGTVGLMVDPTATKLFIGTGTTNATASRLYITETSTNTTELSQIYAQRLMTNPLTNGGGMNMSIQSAHTTADFSGQNIGGIFQAWIRNTNTKNWTSAGTVNQLGLVGLEARVEVRSGASGTISWLAGLVTDGEFNNNSTATVTNYAGFKIFEPVNAGSLLGFTNNYGLYVGDMTAATNNYAVYTGTGLVRFGDKVIFTQTDGNEYIDSEADGYLTIGATSGVLINKMLYGSMYGDDIAHTVTISSAGVYYAITAGLTGGESNGMTFQNNRELLVTVAGKYRVTWSMSLECGSAGQYVEGAVMVNSTAQINTVGASELPSANKKVNVAGSGILALAVNDVVKLCVENETGTNDIIVDHANIELLRIGN